MLAEKDKFCELVVAEGLAQRPSSSHSTSSGGKQARGHAQNVVHQQSRSHRYSYPTNKNAGINAYHHVAAPPPQPCIRQSIRPVSSADLVITPRIQAVPHPTLNYHRPVSADSHGTFDRKLYIGRA